MLNRGRLQYLGRMILLLYLIISFVAPLSTVHVEDLIGSLSWAAAPDGSHAETVLGRLHEMLFRHFSDRAEHVTFSRGLRPEEPSLSGDMSSRTAACEFLPPLRQDADARGKCHVQYSRSQDSISRPADGFRLFCSNLSPPAA